ncbi:MAG: ribosome-binding factor A [Acidimicrobiales bacterium]
MNQVVQGVLGDELELIDDERLELVTITGVRVEPGPAGCRLVLVPVQGRPEEWPWHSASTIRLQKAIARQLRLRGTPLLSFVPDPAIASGSRVEELLRDLHRNEDDGS